jgi:hypothetical protein
MCQAVWLGPLQQVLPKGESVLWMFEVNCILFENTNLNSEDFLVRKTFIVTYLVKKLRTTFKVARGTHIILSKGLCLLTSEQLQAARTKE